MSYRCSICGDKVPHGKQRLVHQVIRRDGMTNFARIVRELPVCERCHAMLKTLPLSSVKNPYYLRPKEGKTRVEILVEHQPAYVPPAQAVEIGRPAKTVIL